MNQQAEGSSDSLLEFMYAAILADRQYLDDPTDENFALAEIAAEKARFAELKNRIADDQGDYANIPTEVRQEFVLAVDMYLQNPTDKNKVLSEKWLDRIKLLYFAINRPDVSDPMQADRDMIKKLRRSVILIIVSYLIVITFAVIIFIILLQNIPFIHIAGLFVLSIILWLLIKLITWRRAVDSNKRLAKYNETSLNEFIFSISSLRYLIRLFAAFLPGDSNKRLAKPNRNPKV